jgi:hypothetical protein
MFHVSFHKGTMLLKKYEVRSNCHCTTDGVGSNNNNDPPSIACSIFISYAIAWYHIFMRTHVSYELTALIFSCSLS